MSRRVAAVLALVLAPAAACDRPQPQPQPQPQPLVDLNHASRTELEALPEIGRVHAAEIIRGRPYDNKRQLVSRGIVTERVYDIIAPLVVAHQR